MTQANSTQIRSALDQLTYVKRILEGDQNLSLEDLLSSANAAQILSTQSENAKEEGDGMIPTGGLHSALNGLLEPLLKPTNTASMQMQLEPRKYVTLANSLARRFGSESKDLGQAGDAIELAKGFAKENDLQFVDKESIFEQRKRRREDGSLGLLSENTKDVPDSWDDENRLKKKTEERNTVPRSSYRFPGQESIPNLITNVRSEIGSLHQPTREEQMGIALKTWKTILSSIDAEAAASLSYSSKWLRSNLVRLRIDIDQVGTAILWISLGKANEEQDQDENILEYSIQLQRINILAETEIDSFDLETGSHSTITNPLHLSTQSTFPLYRQLTGQILSKVLHSFNNKDDSHWRIIFSTLFALAGLCHLHDPFPNFPNTLSNQPCRGTVAVLGAFANWDVE